MLLNKLHKKGSDKLAISPAISSVIMTGAMIAILSVALGFANDFLWTRVAESDYASSKQLMQSVGLQIDDVAWTAGRTETLTYATQYGDVEFEPGVITYNVSVVSDNVKHDFINTTGALMFNMPTYEFSISDDYWVKLYPEPNQDTSLTLTGTSAPVARVFEVEQVPMLDGDYIRVVVAPAIRVLYSSINSSTNTRYVRMYLPVLTAGESPRLYQSITLTGESVTAKTLNRVASITVTVEFPDAAYGFDSDFFNFPAHRQVIDIPSIVIPPEEDKYANVVLELYLSEVSVGFGVS
ncbi:MAG: hypothetical protein ACOWW1_01440 [archaeon]|nr:hypothetical protein [Candidatus Bathyarchaeum sp.]